MAFPRAVLGRTVFERDVANCKTAVREQSYERVHWRVLVEKPGCG